MNIIISILLILAGFISLLLIAGLFMKKDHYVKREITINAPLQKVFDFLRMLQNQDKFNKWAKTDPNRQWEYKGTDGVAGYVISWKGNKDAGEGAKEIINIVEGKRIETEIRFIKPMKVTAAVLWKQKQYRRTKQKYH